MRDADGLLQARNLAPLRRLEGTAVAAVYLCRKARGTTPFRIAVLRAGAVTAEIPDLATAQLVVAASGQLLAGRWVLFAHAPGGMARHVSAFDLDSGTVNPRFFDLGACKSWASTWPRRACWRRSGSPSRTRTAGCTFTTAGSPPGLRSTPRP